MALLGAAPAASQGTEPARAYDVTTCPLPEDVTLEVGGMTVVPGPEGPRVLCSTRRGEVWGVDGFAGKVPTESPAFTRVAEGLHEPLGLLRDRDGGIAVACRGELARLIDGDGDGLYETTETVTDWWQISGNYHEYNFGPTRAIDGSYWITTNKPFGQEPFGRVDWRGYALRITRDGEVTPMCSGLRSPAGVGTSPWGEVFYTDNQGEWCGMSKLSLLVPGSHHGHPWGIGSTQDPDWPWPNPVALPEGKTYAEIDAVGSRPAFQMPTIWFPYDKMGRSPAGFAWDTTEGAFGPFSGQLFVADQYEAAVFRVDLERVRDHWQGACFRFVDGLSSGAIRIEFTDDGALLVGETDRGWGSKGTTTEGLERIDWNGSTPFEMHTMRLTNDNGGFTLRFTSPVDPASFETEGALAMESYTYAATERYGSPELEKETLEVRLGRVHGDGLGVDLLVDGLRTGFVHELRAPGIRGAKGAPLAHAAAYYTLVRLH